jgi:hypothetical protein
MCIKMSFSRRGNYVIEYQLYTPKIKLIMKKLYSRSQKEISIRHQYSVFGKYQLPEFQMVTGYRHTDYRLPITDYRLPITDYPFQSFLIAAIPGRFFPSIYSSMAPPPVDT